jgi:hypothetical protein
MIEILLGVAVMLYLFYRLVKFLAHGRMAYDRDIIAQGIALAEKRKRDAQARR